MLEVVFDEDGRPVDFLCRDVNAAAERLFCRGRDEWLGRSPWEVLAPASVEPFRSQLVAVARMQRTLQGEHRAETSRGPIWLSYQLLPAGRNLAVLLHDVTARKVEEMLRLRSEERLRYVLEGSTDAYWDWNLETSDGVTTEVLERLGYRDIQFGTAEGWLRIMHSADVSRVTSEMRAHLEGKTPHFVSEHRVYAKDGDVHWVLTRGKVVARAADGRPLRMAGTVTDITQRKRAEEELREREFKYTAIFNSAFQLTGLLDAEGRVLETNQAALAFAGKRAHELVGRPFWDACWWTQTSEEQARLHELVARAAGGDFVRVELAVCGGAGRQAVLDFSLTPVRDESGAVVYLVPEGRDITEKKQLEDSVQRAEKMEAIGRMAGGIAHDFNNLLNVIAGFNELLSADVGQSGRAAVAVNEIRRAVDRAGLLIQQLLVVSRRQMLVPVVMDLNAVILDARNMVKRAVGDYVELVLRLDAECPQVHADPAKVEHVLLNLAINARDAMPEGGVLTITTRNVVIDESHPLRSTAPKAGAYVELAVSDTGTGMDEQTRERIFEPFFTTKPRGKGTGLGLATVYGIVTQSDGAIHVDTTLGRGSTFRIFLPSADEASGPV